MAYYKSGLKTYTAAAITNTVAGFVRAVQRSIAVKTTTKTSSGFDYQSTSGTTGGSGMAYPLRPSSEYFRIIMYDQYNNMSNVISSAVSFHCKDVVNGGSAEGEFRIPKKFVDTAFLGELLGLAGRPRSCRLQLYLPDSVDPWYDGRIITVDQIQSSSKDDEVISIITEGWQNALGDAIVSESVNPGVQPNGQNNNSINADTYLIHLFQTYADLTLFNSIMFCTSTGYGSLPISLNALQFDGQELNKCIDDVVKQIVDQTGFIVEWWVRGINPSRNGPAGNGKLNIIVQANQNPSLSSGGAIANPNGLDPNGSHIRPYFVYAMKDVDLYDYNVQTTAQGVYNMIALYGGRDPITQQQIYQAFIRSDSISLYGIRQKKLTQSNLLSYNTLVLFATQWLAVNAFPQPQATFKMTTPHDSLKGGKWVQVMAPGFGVVQSGTTTGSGLTVTGGPNLQRITVTVSTGALYAGMEVRINSGQANEETVTLQEGSVGSTMVAIFANNHTAENWKSVGTAGQLAVPSAAQQIQQVRAVSVELQLQEGADKIEQVVSATAPRPFIDHAYYGAIQSASENNSVFNNRGGTASSQLYVYGGGGAQAGYQDGSGIWNVVINQVMISVGKSGTLDPNSNQPPSSGGSGYNQISIPSSPGTTTVKIKDYASGLSPDGYYEIVATTNPQTIFGVGTDGNPQLVCTFIGSNNTRTPYGPQIVRLWGFTLSQSGANLHGIVDLRSVSPQI
jgi:hypothetical protein